MPEDLSRLHGYDDWLRFHRDVVDRVITKKKKIEVMDLVVSRGGLTKPLEGGGAYRINEAMLHDLRSGEYGWHPANIGPAIASQLALRYGVDAIVYDGPVVVN